MKKNKKQRDPLSYLHKMLAIKRAGISIMPTNVEVNDLDSLNVRIEKILGIQQNLKSTDMIYFIMYDIEDNKIRSQIVKYLLKKGAFRIQKSIFMARSERALFHEIHQALKTISELYENSDSIIMIPVSTDVVNNMKLMGANVDIEFITKNKNTLII